MKAKDVVTIYEDPLTCKQSEGQARLLERLANSRNNGPEYWRVKFLSDNYVTNRFILGARS